MVEESLFFHVKMQRSLGEGLSPCGWEPKWFQMSAQSRVDPGEGSQLSKLFLFHCISESWPLTSLHLLG